MAAPEVQASCKYKKLRPCIDDVRALETAGCNTRAVVQYEQWDSATHKGYYEFFHVDMDKFLDEYLSPTHGGKPRRYHESIFPSAHIKIFADVEYEDENLDGTEEEKLSAILTQMEDAMRQKLDMEEIPPPLIADACIPGKKFSVHIIYPVWMENSQHVMALVKDIPGIDMAPYASASLRTCKFLRMPFSEKFAKNNPLVPRGMALAEEGKPIDAETMCRGLLSWVVTDPESKYYEFLQPPTIVYSMSPADLGTAGTAYGLAGGHGTISLTAGNEIKGRANRILAHLKQTRQDFTDHDLEVNANGSWSCTITPAFPCPTKLGGKHSSHSMFLGSYDSRKVFIRCPGNKCRTSIYLPEDFTPIAFADVDFSESSEHAWFDESVLWPGDQ